MHVSQISSRIRIAGVIFDQLRHYIVLGFQLTGIIHATVRYVFFFYNEIGIDTAVVGNLNIKIRQVFCDRTKGMYNLLPGNLILDSDLRQKHARNVDFHIVLKAALQLAVYFYKIIVFLLYFRNAWRLIGKGRISVLLFKHQGRYPSQVFPYRFDPAVRRHVDIAHGSDFAVAFYLHLLLILQIQFYLRIGRPGKKCPVMGVGQAVDIQVRSRTVRIGSGVQVDIVGTGKLALHRHAVIAGHIVVCVGYQYACKAIGIAFCYSIHRNRVAAAESNVVSAFVSAILVQLRTFIYGDIIGRCDLIVTVHPLIRSPSAVHAFHLVGNVQVRMGFINLAIFCIHFGVLANLYSIRRFYIRLAFNLVNLHKSFDFHVVVPMLVAISARNNRTGRRHIALACLQNRVFRNLGLRIHLHLIMGMRPDGVEHTAGSALGCAFGGNLLLGSYLRFAGHIPGPGKGSRIFRLGCHVSRGFST